MTRAEARAYFTAKGLTYLDISGTDLELLKTLLDRHFSQARRERLAAGKPVYWQRVIGIRGEHRASGSMIWTNITAKGATFTTTNVVSFNRHGFIYFCGEASHDDIQPVLRAFVEWCDRLAELKEIGKGGADNGSS